MAYFPEDNLREKIAKKVALGGYHTSDFRVVRDYNHIADIERDGIVYIGYLPGRKKLRLQLDLKDYCKKKKIKFEDKRRDLEIAKEMLEKENKEMKKVYKKAKEETSSLLKRVNNILR